MNFTKYDVLAHLDIATTGDDNAKNVASWINALSDGEYLARFNYDETIVNDAVELLERLNTRTQFVIFNSSVTKIETCCIGFDALMDTLLEIAENDTTKHYTIMAVIPHKFNVYIIQNETARNCIDNLEIYQLIETLYYCWG